METMIDKGATVLVVGLGRSGRAAARFLVARGCRVLASDRMPLERLDPEVRALQAAGVELSCGSHDARLFERADRIVVSPGVPADLPPLAAARSHGVPVISELDLVAERVENRAVVVTGSNGKSTTTSLVEAMLRAAGRDAVACGNWGVPLVDAVADDDGSRWYSIELSSFQLESIRSLRAAAAILLNVQPDHLDRHGTLQRYLELKLRVAGLRTPGAPLVLGVDDERLAGAAAALAPPVLGVSAGRRLPEGGWLEGDLLVAAPEGVRIPLVRRDEMSLVGRHNLVNALAASVAVLACGVEPAAVRRALSAFRPLAHRMCPVGTVDGVHWVDDSKATNVASTLAAIAAFAEAGAGLIVLLGGRDKGADFAPLAAALATHEARAVTFGEAGPKIAGALESGGITPLASTGTMAEAVDAARRHARRGETVLLSPACASFDEFENFERRGERFAELVRAMSEARR